MRIVLGLLFVLLLLAGVVAANLVSLRLHSPLHRFDIGTRGDQFLLDGVFGREQDQLGTTYRWTTEETVLTFNGVAVARPAILTLALGWLPPSARTPRPVQLALDGTPWSTLHAAATPRHYHVLLPPHALTDGDLRLRLTTETSSVPPDRRAVGVRLDDIALRQSATAWALPPLRVLLVQWGLVLLGVGIAWSLGATSWLLALVAAALTAWLAWMSNAEFFVAAAWHTRMLGAGVIGLGALRLGLPPLRRAWPPEHEATLRWIMLVTVLAVAVRMLGIFYPLFNSHDLYIHERRMLQVQAGSLQLLDRPAEFAGQLALVPPAFYLLVAPFTLFVSNALALQGLYAFLDGTAPLLLALLLRRLGASPRAALFAAIAMACLPIQFIALYWGFGPQIVGQWMTLLLALLVSAGAPRTTGRWIVVGVLLCAILLMHNGVAVLAGVWLAGYALLVWLRGDRAQGQRWVLLLTGTGVVATALLYLDAVRLRVAALGESETTATALSDSGLLAQIWVGLRASFEPLPLALTAMGLALLASRLRGAARSLVYAWLASAGLFLLVDLLTGLQVRYGYFVLPLVGAGGALLIERLMARHGGHVVGWAVLGLLAYAGLSLWYAGAFLGIKPSLNALTH